MKHTATEEISMIEQFCPNPVILQRLLAGPLSAHINAIAQQLSQQGYTSSSAKNAMRLLDDLSSWLLRQALTAADFNEQLASEFLQDRYRRCRPHLNDRAALRRLLKHLRYQGIIPISRHCSGWLSIFWYRSYFCHTGTVSARWNLI